MSDPQDFASSHLAHFRQIQQKAAEATPNRVKTLTRVFQTVLGDWEGIYLQGEILRHAVESYFLDIYRMKAFHQIELADQHKRASFTMFWIAKLRPIQIYEDANMTDALHLINERFALHAGLSHLDIGIEDISENYTSNLMYTLHYRQFPPEVLTSMMYLLECACKGNKP